jgi:hypothetical protein
MIGVSVVLLIVIIYVLMRDSGVSLSTMQSADTETTVLASAISSNETTNFTYSTWFFVRDWATGYGGEKGVLTHGSVPATDEGGVVRIYLGSNNNDINVDVNYMGSSETDLKTHTCRVSNIPLQKWVNVIVSVYGRSMDMYIDGKLSRTCVLPAPVKPPSPNDNLVITPDGGFDGWTSAFMYWADATNPTDARAIYRRGYGGSMLGNLFNKYRMRFSFIKDGREMNSFEV